MSLDVTNGLSPDGMHLMREMCRVNESKPPCPDGTMFGAFCLLLEEHRRDAVRLVMNAARRFPDDPRLVAVLHALAEDVRLLLR